MTTLEKLQEAIAGHPEKVESGFKTASQWAREWQIGDSTARRILNGAIGKGIAEIRNFKIRSGQVFRPVPHYKLCLK